jgi:hypothetical protein
MQGKKTWTQRTKELALGSALAVSPFMGGQAKSQEPVEKPPAVAQDNVDAPKQDADAIAHEKAVRNCVELMHGCQLPNGAIDLRTHWNPKDAADREQAEIEVERNVLPKEKLDYEHRDSIRVVPYFSNYAALGMISAYESVTHDVKDLEYAAKWMKFYADEQDKETGYIHDYHGSRHQGTFIKSEEIDSVDAYASTYLQLAERYSEALKKCTPEEREKLNEILPADKLMEASKLCVKAIESVVDTDGLTWAKPDWPVKYLMDNVEVYGGLISGANYFEAQGVKSESKKCRDMAKEVGKNLSEYWRADEKHFAWAKQGDFHWDTGLDEAYPHGLANLYALPWIPEKPEEKHVKLWEEMKEKFKPEEPGYKNVDETAPLDRWLMSAIALKDPDVEKWKERLTEQMTEFPKHRNVHRLGIATLAALEGREWMHSIAQPEKDVEKGRGK